MIGSERAASGNSLRSGTLVLLSFALVVALITRLPFAFEFGIDDDEFYTTRYALELFDAPTPEAARRYPLTFFAARIGLEIFGLGGAALRWLPLACGVGAIFLLARRGERLVGARAAAFAAVLLAFWPWHQYFSGLGRYYAPLFFVGIGICESLERALEKPRIEALVEVASWTVAGVLIHPSALLGLAGIAVLAIDPRRRERFGGRATLAVFLLSAAALLVLRFSGAWHNIERVLSREGGEGADAIQLALNLGFNITPLVIVLAVVGALAGWSERRSSTIFLVVTAALPIAVLAILAALGQGVQGRYATVGFPALLCLAGAGIAAILERAEVVALRRALCAALLLPFVPGLISNLRDGDRHDVPGAATAIRGMLGRDTTVYAEGHALLSLLTFGPARERPAGLGDPPFPRFFGECPPEPAQLAAIDAGSDPAVFVVRDRDLRARGGDAGNFATWLNREARIVERIGVRRLDYRRNELVVLERRSRGGGG